jgi:lysophospholipase L1-like esterase
MFVRLTATLVALCGLGACDLPNPDARIVAFGDSTTRGPSDRDYIDVVHDLLGPQAPAVANAGNGGETATEGVARLRDLLDFGVYPNAEVLIYWQGGNDLIDTIITLDPLLLLSPMDPDYPYIDALNDELDRIEAAVSFAITLARLAGLDVLVANYFFLPNGSFECDPLPLDLLLPLQASNANAYVAQLNDRIALAAARQGATLIDVAALDDTLRSDDDHYENCNHLSESGNAIVAELFVEALNKLSFSFP